MSQRIKLAPGEVAKIDQPESWEVKFDQLYLPIYLELPEAVADDFKERNKDFIRQLLREQRLEDSIEPDDV